MSTSGPPCLMSPSLPQFKQITLTLTAMRHPCFLRVRQAVNLFRTTTTNAHNFWLPFIAALQPAAVKAAAVNRRTVSSATTVRQLGEVIRRHVCRHVKQLPTVLRPNALMTSAVKCFLKYNKLGKSSAASSRSNEVNNLR